MSLSAVRNLKLTIKGVSWSAKPSKMHSSLEIPDSMGPVKQLHVVFSADTQGSYKDLGSDPSSGPMTPSIVRFKDSPATQDR